MASSKTATKDPRKIAPKPPFADQPQPPPGHEEPMRPRPDHGEKTYVGHDRLKGKVALITGADSGIGRAIAVAFAREGADVGIAYLEEEDDARQTEKLVQETNRKALRLPGDIQNESHCRDLVKRTLDQFGRLDILVNNAAYQMTHQEIEEVSSEEFERTFRTNVFALFYLCQAALREMQPGASIINTASIQGFDQSPYLLDYAPSKAAIIGFTKALARMVAKRGIRVNAVAPGPLWTPLISSTMPADKVKKFGENSVFGRPAQPAELAPLYVLLASPEASYVTGEVFAATGGRTPI